MMLTCRDLVRLWSGDELRRAPLGRRLAVRMHLLFCHHCTRYVQQLGVIRAAAKPAMTNDPAYQDLERRILGAIHES